MLMKRFTQPFRQLRGKLTLSYTLTSVVTFLLVELIFITVVLWVVSLNLSAFVLSSLAKEAPQAAPFFVHGSPNREELTSWLYVANADLPNLGPQGQSRPIFLAVVNTQGQTIASIGSHPVPVATPLQVQLSPESRANLQAVLNDGRGATSKISQGTDGILVAETPIVGQKGNVQGALVMKIAKPDIFRLV